MSSHSNAHTRARIDVENALFREALRRWVEWLVTLHGEAPRRGGDEADAGTVYDAAMRRLTRAPGDHADPTLGRLLADERRQWDWPASIHAIVMDMPIDWRVCLLGTALEYSQAFIGRKLGLRQQLVSVMLGHARRTLLERLKVLARTGREMKGLGFG
jgi:hypothetical protein